MYELRMLIKDISRISKGGTTVEQVHLQYLHTMPKKLVHI